MILLIDNFDSFTYNLYQMMGSINPDITVVRNDAVSVDDIFSMNPQAIVLSPGPGRPEDAGICMEAIKACAGKIPMMGICLGHQAICAAYGATVSYAERLMHGKQSIVTLDLESPLFAGLPQQIEVARYHSLVALPDTIPNTLKVTATTTAGEIMAVEAKDAPVYGLQFHPESILTPQGATILKNFVGGCLKC